MAPRVPNYGVEGRLSMIAEDASYQPAQLQPGSHFSADQSSVGGAAPKKSRPGSVSHSSKGSASGSLPRPSADTAPPGYTLWDVTGPKGEKFLDVRNNKHIARRGGWKRLLIIAAVLIAIAISLGVGLGVGLTRRNNQSNNAAPAPVSATSQPADSGPFPQGSFTMPGNLATQLTNCTSVPSTWTCWPSNIFASNSAASGVAFQWVVGNASNDANQLTISSSDNPLAPFFNSTSLTLLDQGTDNERYHFAVQLDKYVETQDSLASNDVRDGCTFRQTMFEGVLYTRKKADANANTNGQAAARTNWDTWPGAWEVNQTIAGGADVPVCNELRSDGPTGPRVTTGLTDEGASAECGCYWRNFNLS